MTTNYERIKAMTIEEMAVNLSILTRAIVGKIFKLCGINEDFSSVDLDITRDFFKWLQAESEEK